METELSIYEKHYPLLHNFLLKSKYYKNKDEYKSFIQFKYCQIVDRYYRKNIRDSINSSADKYISKSMLKAIHCRNYKNVKAFKNPIYVDPTDFETQICIFDGKENNKLINRLIAKENVLDKAMLRPFIYDDERLIDKKSDLLRGLCSKEICFVVLWGNNIKQGRIAKRFKMSVKTVQRVIESAKQKVHENADKLNYLKK